MLDTHCLYVNERLHGRRRCQATGANQREQTAGAATWRDRGLVEVPQGRIRVREIGDGEPLLFVHGYLVDGRLWDGVAERLAGDFRCIVPDCPSALTGRR